MIKQRIWRENQTEIKAQRRDATRTKFSFCSSFAEQITGAGRGARSSRTECKQIAGYQVESEFIYPGASATDATRIPPRNERPNGLEPKNPTVFFSLAV